MWGTCLDLRDYLYAFEIVWRANLIAYHFVHVKVYNKPEGASWVSKFLYGQRDENINYLICSCRINNMGGYGINFSSN